MKIYILTGGWTLHGDDILGAFSSDDIAQKVRTEYIQKDYDSGNNKYEYYEIEEFELDKL